MLCLTLNDALMAGGSKTCNQNEVVTPTEEATSSPKAVDKEDRFLSRKTSSAFRRVCDCDYVLDLPLYRA